MAKLPRTVGSYRVKERLEGHGREVYIATRPAEKGDSRYVLAFFDLNDDDMESFEAEVMRSMELDHPQLTRAVDLLVHEGRQVVVYEGPGGASLARFGEHLAAMGQPLSDGAALAIAKAVADGINAAHTAKGSSGNTLPLVHAQLGPHQVFLSHKGEVTVLGIGLSTVFRLAAGAGSVPEEVATYIAPEVRQGGALTVRANVYTVAGIAWSLLTHEDLPAQPEPLRKKRPKLDRKLAMLIDRALSPNLMRRTVTCAQLARVIEASGLCDPAELTGHMEELRALESFEMSTIGVESFPPSQLADVPPTSVPELLSLAPDSKEFRKIALPIPDGEVSTLRGVTSTLRPGPATEPEPSTIPRGRPALPRAKQPVKLRRRETVVGPPPAPRPAEPSNSSEDDLDWGESDAPAEPSREASPSTKSSAEIEPATALADAGREADLAELDAPEQGNAQPGEAEPVEAEPEPVEPEPAEAEPEPVQDEPVQDDAKDEPAQDEPVQDDAKDGPDEARERAVWSEPPAAPPLDRGLPTWVYAAGGGLFVVGLLIGRFTAPTVGADVATSSSAALATSGTSPPPETKQSAAEPTPTAVPSATAAPTASASSEPAEEDDVAPDRSRLVVTTVFPDAHVYLGGEYLGLVDTPLDVKCGIVNIRLGTKPLKRWFDSARAVNAKCGEVVKVTIAPDPDPYADDIY
jgi:eukaryotic-like serine/threonine-protein kinase